MGVQLPFPTPQIEYSLLLPVLVILGAAVVSVLIEAVAAESLRRTLQPLLAFGSLAIALAGCVGLWDQRQVVAQGALVVDGPTVILQGTLLILAVLGALLMMESRVDPAGDPFAARASTIPGSADERGFGARRQTEVWPLFLFAVGGMLMFPAANDLLTAFIALEVFSLPLYLLTGMARRRRLLSQEAALKYFVLGAFSSAVFLFGSALIYAATGSLDFAGIADAVSADPTSGLLLSAGVALLLAGMLFKVGAAPFHQWSPDVYQGAPTALTAFMSAATKVAAFGALLRVMFVALGGAAWDWQPAVAVIAGLSMLVGAITAVVQSDIKRVLAYSSVAHAGFILTGVLAASPKGLSGSLVYLVAYGFVTLAAFGLLTVVRSPAGEATDVQQWAGLAKKSPVTASVFSLLLLTMAGLPLTSGFTAKFAAWSAAWGGWQTGVVVIGAVSSTIAAAFYLRIIVSMWFSEGDDAVVVALPGLGTRTVVGVGVASAVVFGVAPQLLLGLVDGVGVFLR
ncbi:MAG: NADH-quinone oxidoreductase subunit NuoN [Actinomycetales bacterium]|nr:NADH-quinone oxidoreductase subunit NuoN [Actinomycetales bacterium]